ncbi:MAG TPA: hypothetical protein VN851_04135 [Thermoanaerobaculia bacterium]|nr:hypothetical protein [Thermoanaerobaculia bacterium]
MRSQVLRILSILGLALASARGLQAACPSLRPLVLLGAPNAFLLKADLGLTSGAIQWTPATHGVVTDGGDRLIYTPNPSFWDLGIDSIVVTTSGRADLPKTVQWVAATRHGEPSIEDFEGHSDWDLGWFDPEAICELGALSGSFGLRFTAISGGGSTSATAEGPDGNGATAGGGAVASWHPPGGGGGQNGSCGGAGQECPFGIWYRFLAADGDHDHFFEYSVYVKESGDTVQVGLSPGDSLPPGTDPIALTTVSRETHRLELLNWLTTESAAAGAALWIDGRRALAIEEQGLSRQLVPSSGGGPTFTFDAVPASVTSGSPGLAHSFDNFAVFQIPGQARYDCLAADGFDNGALDSVWTPINETNLSVLSAAALAGRGGLDVHLVDIGPNVGGLLSLVGFQGQSRHGLKFRFDPNSTEFETGALLNLALGRQPGSAIWPFLAFLKRNASGFVVHIQSRDDHGVPRSTPVAISDAPHVLELDWQRSATTHAPSGYLRAWIDGVLVAEHLNVDNDDESITEIRVGALGLAGAAKGHVYLDQIEAWAEALPAI